MRIQTSVLRLMAWFLVGALLALTAVGCESDSPDQTGPGESAQASAREGVGSTPESIPQVRLTPRKEIAEPGVDSTPEITPQVSPTPGEETTGDYGDGRQESTTQVSSTMKEENVSTRRPTREEIRAATERAQAVRLKYEDLFSRQPNIWGVGIGRALHPNGEVSEEIGIVISVTKKVDQITLPPEDQIPDRLEDIPVYLMEEPLPVLTPELPRVNPKEEESDGGR